jgi:LysM repeat protein
VATQPEDIMLDTLTPETTPRPAQLHGLRPGPVQHRVVVHRPGVPRPALRRSTPGVAPSALPPSEQRRRHPAPVPAPELRLTRRGRLTVLIASLLLLCTAFSVGQVMSNAATSAPQPATHTVVVAPGDTAWSIARAAMPHLDGRQAVDRLLAVNHSDGNIRVGQTLTVPGS